MMKKYQIYANAIISVNGFVRANNKKEAQEKYEEYIKRHITHGTNLIEIKTIDVLPEKGDPYEDFPDDEEFDPSSCGNDVIYADTGF